MNLEQFLEEAASCDAVVFLAMHDAASVGGQLQSLLDVGAVAYTGVGTDIAAQCADRVAVAEVSGLMHWKVVFKSNCPHPAVVLGGCRCTCSQQLLMCMMG